MATLFVSDLHLDASSPQAVAAFVGLLEGAAREADALYLLGDLFESWIGDDDWSMPVTMPQTRWTARAALTLVLAGQYIASMLIEQFGWFGAPVRPFEWTRLAGILILLLGVWLTTRR